MTSFIVAVLKFSNQSDSRELSWLVHHGREVRRQELQSADHNNTSSIRARE